jgi:hypothetical protein
LSGFGTGDHMLPEMARVLDAIVSHRAGRVSCVTAGELQGLSERHFRHCGTRTRIVARRGWSTVGEDEVSSSRVPDAEAE